MLLSIWCSFELLRNACCKKVLAIWKFKKHVICSSVIFNICKYIFSLGEGGNLVDRGDNTYGGKWVINPSGGLISKGHPLGATGNDVQSFHTLFIIIWRKCEWLVIDLNERLYSLNLVASALNDCLATVFFVFLYVQYTSVILIN